MIELPTVVAKLTYILGAWIVGSAADTASVIETRDVDIVVPFDLWAQAAQIIPASAVPNTFGGWKFTDTGMTKVDVWPDDLARLFLNAKCKVAWHPKSGVRIRKEAP